MPYILILIGQSRILWFKVGQFRTLEITNGVHNWHFSRAYYTARPQQIYLKYPKTIKNNIGKHYLSIRKTNAENNNIWTHKTKNKGKQIQRHFN